MVSRFILVRRNGAWYKWASPPVQVPIVTGAPTSGYEWMNEY